MTKQVKKIETTAKTSKYQELNDSELEIICGGGNHDDCPADGSPCPNSYYYRNSHKWLKT